MPPALKLRALGHNVIFAVRDVIAARAILAPHGFRYVPAPSFVGRASVTQPASYAEILLCNGYGSHEDLDLLVESWLRLFKEIRADVLIANHAPSATLASQCASVPSVATCIGFEIPPTHGGPRPFYVNTLASQERLLKSEESALKNINSVLGSNHCPGIGGTAEIFAQSKVLMTTFPELDHYGPRKEHQYIGSISGIKAPEYGWKKPNANHVFCYLRKNVPSIHFVLEALQQSNNRTLCIIPDANRTELDRYEGANMEVRSEPVDITAAVRQADVVITYGTGSMHDALLQGKPLLICPRNAEQFLAGKKVVALGAGLILPVGASSIAINQVLSLLISDLRYSDAAKRFAEKYGDFTVAQAVERIVDTALSVC